MKIGLIGGTFDPIHVGHLLLGEWAKEQLELDEIWFLPAGMPYFKEGTGVSSRTDRLAMTKRAAARLPGAKVCELELKRAGRTYTYETAEELTALYPEHEFTFVFGSDCLDQLEIWRCPERILACCGICAATRGSGADLGALREKAAALSARFGGRIRVMAFPALDISSTLIRARAGAGLPLSFLLPEDTEAYVLRQELYRESGADAPEGSPSPRTVIFDMDGTLLDTERLFIDVWMDMEDDPPPQLEQVLHDVIGTNEVSTKRHFAEVLGEDYPYEARRARLRQIFAQIREAGALPVKPGAKECVKALYRAGFRLALATSTSRAIAEAEMKAVGFYDYFDVIVCGDDITRSKPDPEIFLKAAALLETPPGACLVLEDSANGIRAAHAAGMRPILVPDLKAPDGELRALSERICPDLSAACAYILEELGGGR